MSVERAINIDDLERIAKRRLPRILYDVIASGTEDETCLTRNRTALADYYFLPRYLGSLHPSDLTTTLFGETHAMPFGIAPTGFAGLFRPGADDMLAQAAALAKVPYILSGASSASIVEVAARAPRSTWAHLYLTSDFTITTRQLARIEESGSNTLVITVDNPVSPKRERDMRNGFALPLRLRLPVMLEVLTHPSWLFHYFRTGGFPAMADWVPFAPVGASAQQVAACFRQHSPSIQTWETLQEIRKHWRGRVILKGIQHPEDASRAIDLGMDGIIVSNHGGKAFDRLPSPVETLPAIKVAARGRVPVMLDSGIRRGSDIAVARCLGADFVFVGRATLYGVVAGGTRGATRALQILRDELAMTLAMIGCQRAADLSPSYLLRSGAKS